jgi:metal-dependent amidase/aminoacylase/carboxypeptidase family protein
MSEAARFTEVSDLVPAAESLREIRHHIHHHPELAYEEHQTGALVADKLEQWGWQVTRGVGQTGVVGTLKVGDGKRSIGIRADMDALPIIEQTGLPPRRAHHDAARRGATPRGYAQFFGHGASVLSACRGERHRQRRAEDDQRRPVRALSL